MFIADEDSGKETASESLNAHGTLAYKGTIDKSFVNLFLEVKVPKQFLDEWKQIKDHTFVVFFLYLDFIFYVLHFYDGREIIIYYNTINKRNLSWVQ